ncbi:MAG: HAD family hydrolase [Proteobacteria bacterium]|jgi:phosphoglycolate phosphatase|nr:HAD family hydrolase [Pseudomonadota bacterium]
MKAVIFDMDGTLVDSGELAIEAARLGVGEYGERHALELLIPSRQRVLSLLGLPSLEYFAGLLPSERRDDAEELRELVGAWEERMLAEGQGRLFAGVEQALAELRRRGWQTALVSNCGRHYFKANIVHLDLARWMDFLACADDGPSKTANVAEALRMLGTNHGAMVGDRLGDIEAGQANGLKTIGVQQGYGTVAELSGADSLIDDFTQLIGSLEALCGPAMNSAVGG